MAAQSGTLLPCSLQSNQGDVIVTAVWPVVPVDHNLLNPYFLFKLLGYQSMVIPNSNCIAPGVVPIPGRKEQDVRVFSDKGKLMIDSWDVKIEQITVIPSHVLFPFLSPNAHCHPRQSPWLSSLTLTSPSLDDYCLGSSKCGEGVEKIRTTHQAVSPLSNGKVSKRNTVQCRTAVLVCHVHMCGGISTAAACVPVLVQPALSLGRSLSLLSRESRAQPDCQQRLAVLLYFDVTSMKLNLLYFHCIFFLALISIKHFLVYSLTAL